AEHLTADRGRTEVAEIHIADVDTADPIDRGRIGCGLGRGGLRSFADTVGPGAKIREAIIAAHVGCGTALSAVQGAVVVAVEEDDDTGKAGLAAVPAGVAVAVSEYLSAEREQAEVAQQN